MILRSTFFAALLAISSIVPIFADTAPTTTPEKAPGMATCAWSALANLRTIAKITATTGIGLIAGIAIVATIKGFGGDVKDCVAGTIKATTALGLITGCSVVFCEGLAPLDKSTPEYLAHTIQMKELAIKEKELELKKQVPYVK